MLKVCDNISMKNVVKCVKSVKLLNVKLLNCLVTIRMNDIFPCLACYGQKPKFFVWKSRQNTSSVKGSGKDEIGTIFPKSDIHYPF